MPTPEFDAHVSRAFGLSIDNRDALRAAEILTGADREALGPALESASANTMAGANAWIADMKGAHLEAGHQEVGAGACAASIRLMAKLEPGFENPAEEQQMATDDPIAPRDFIGVPAILQKATTHSLADGTTRLVVTTSIAVGEANRDLILELMMHMKQTVFVGYGFAQAALDFDAAAVDEPDNLLQHAKAQGIDLVNVVDSDGYIYLPHRFLESKEGKNVCTVCEAGADHPIHSEANIRQRQELRESQQALAQANGTTAPADADDAPMNGDGPVHIEPVDEHEAAAQTAAKEALAATSARK